MSDGYSLFLGYLRRSEALEMLVNGITDAWKNEPNITPYIESGHVRIIKPTSHSIMVKIAFSEYLVDFSIGSEGDNESDHRLIDMVLRCSFYKYLENPLGDEHELVEIAESVYVKLDKSIYEENGSCLYNSFFTDPQFGIFDYLIQAIIKDKKIVAG